MASELNYEKLWQIAQMTPDVCIGIEQALANNQKFPEYPEYQELIDALTPEEKAEYHRFIGAVNGLRWEIKSLKEKRFRALLNPQEAILNLLPLPN
jgi:signal transduction protein with GAF and PtsI domain